MTSENFSIIDKFILQDFKLSFFEANIYTKNLRLKLEPLITNKESYQEFFKFVIWLAENNFSLVNQIVYSKVLVECFYAEKKFKTKSFVLEFFNTLLPDTAFFLNFFSFLFESSHEHRRGKTNRSVNRSIKRAIEKWFVDKGSVEVANEMRMVRMRGGWSHRDILHLARISFSQQDLKLLSSYIFKGWKAISHMDSQEEVFKCFKTWNSIKKMSVEEEIIDIINKEKLFYYPDNKFNSNLKVRICLMSHAPIEQMLKVLPKLCNQVISMENLDVYVPMLEQAFLQCIQSQPLLRINFLDVLNCLQNNELIFANIKFHLLQLLYKIPTCMKASGKKISIILDTKVLESPMSSSFYTLASAYVCMLARVESSCWFAPFLGTNTVPVGCSIEEINASILKTLFESSVHLGLFKNTLVLLGAPHVPIKTVQCLFIFYHTQSNVEQLKSIGGTIDVVLVLTANCVQTSFDHLCEEFQSYQQESNKEFKLLVVDLLRKDYSIQSGMNNILLDGNNARCLRTINYLCLQ